jgi:hypothetical protein
VEKDKDIYMIQDLKLRVGKDKGVYRIQDRESYGILLLQRLDRLCFILIFEWFLQKTNFIELG